MLSHIETPRTQVERDWVFARIANLAQQGIDCMSLPYEDQEQIARLGFWRWLDGQTVTKTIARTRINTGEKEGEKRDLDPEYLPEVLVTRKGGRPRKKDKLTAAEKQRHYRERKTGR